MKEGFYKKGRRFFNPYIRSMKRSLFDIALWQLGFYKDRKHRVPNPMPKGFKYPNPSSSVFNDQSIPTVTWINHSTFFLKVGKVRVLTDPIWSERCSPFKSIGPKRIHQAPFQLDSLVAIDLLILSHDHYDHFCKDTVQRLYELNPHMLCVVPLGVKKRLHKLGIRNIIEMKWWDTTTVGIKGEHVSLTCVPSQHFSGRGVFDKNTTLWCGYVMDFVFDANIHKRAYFVGDTGYNDKQFKMVGDTFEYMDLSLIPIGTYDPEKFMSPVHIDPNDAVNIHQDVGSLMSIGMHWKTFRLSSEGMERPPYDLYQALHAKNLDHKEFRVLDPGQTIHW